MKKVLFSLVMMFCMSFAASKGYSKQEKPIVEKERAFSFSTNFP